MNEPASRERPFSSRYRRLKTPGAAPAGTTSFCRTSCGEREETRGSPSSTASGSVIASDGVPSTGDRVQPSVYSSPRATTTRP